MVTAAGYDCIDMRAVSNGEAATHKSTEDARIFTAEPGNTIRPGEQLELWGASQHMYFSTFLKSIPTGVLAMFQGS